MRKDNQVWVVDDDESSFRVLEELLHEDGYAAERLKSGEGIFDAIAALFKSDEVKNGAELELALNDGERDIHSVDLDADGDLEGTQLDELGDAQDVEHRERAQEKAGEDEEHPFAPGVEVRGLDGVELGIGSGLRHKGGRIRDGGGGSQM